MPTFNRPRRQALTTFVLFAATIAPTVFVIWTAWRVNRPAHAREVEIELGRILGVLVSLDSVRYPRPGETAFGGLVLRQAEPGDATFREVARAERLSARRGDRQWQFQAVGLKLRGDGPREALARFSSFLQRRGLDAPGSRVTLAARTCLIETGEGDASRYELRDLAASFDAERNLPTLTASFRLGDRGSEGSRCELTLTRDPALRPARTTLSIDAKDGVPIPARALNPFFDAGDWLGPDARVWGSLILSRSDGAEGWDAVFRGDLIDVDLSALVERHYPQQRLSGRARIKFASARWGLLPGRRGFGWVNVAGELHAGPGSIGRELVRGLTERLRFQVDPSTDKHQGDVPFLKLGFSFELASDGRLDFKGALGPENPEGAVVLDADRAEPIVYAPRGSAGAIGLINTLVPPVERAVLVPGTRESQRLQQYLPLPDVPTVSRAHAN